MVRSATTSLFIVTVARSKRWLSGIVLHRYALTRFKQLKALPSFEEVTGSVNHILQQRDNALKLNLLNPAF